MPCVELMKDSLMKRPRPGKPLKGCRWASSVMMAITITTAAIIRTTPVTAFVPFQSHQSVFGTSQLAQSRWQVLLGVPHEDEEDPLLFSTAPRDGDKTATTALVVPASLEAACRQLWKSDGDDEALEQRRQMYELVQREDPDWYQEFVLDVFQCDPKDLGYPAVISSSSTKGDDKEANTDDSNNIQAEVEIASVTTTVPETIVASTDMNAMNTERQNFTSTATTNPSRRAAEINDSATAPMSQVDSIATLNQTMATSSTSNLSSNTAAASTLEEPFTSKNQTVMTTRPLQSNTSSLKSDMGERVSPIVTTNASESSLPNNVTLLSGNTTTSEAPDANLSILLEATIPDNLTSNGDSDAPETAPKSISFPTTPTSSANNKTATLAKTLDESPVTATLNQKASIVEDSTGTIDRNSSQSNQKAWSSKGSLNQTTSTRMEDVMVIKAQPSDNTTTDDSPKSSSSEKIVIYRDSKKGWQTVGLQQLLEWGYRQEEIQELLPDALAIIVQEEIRRPRTLGLPAPWKASSRTSESASPKVQVLANPKDANVMLKYLQTQEEKETADTAKYKSSRRDLRVSMAPPPPVGKKETNSRSVPRQPQREKSTGIRPQTQRTNPKGIRDDEEEPQPFTSTSTAKADTNPLLKKVPNDSPRSRSAMSSVGKDPRQTKDVTLSTPPSQNLKSDEIRAAVDEASTNKTVASHSTLDEVNGTAVVYRNFRGALAMVPFANLTALGYTTEDIESLKSEALAIIITDRISRPRQGIPKQWKTVGDKSAEVNFVEAIGQAEVLIDADKEDKRARTKKSPPSEVTDMRKKSSIPKVDPVDAIPSPRDRRRQKGENLSSREQPPRARKREDRPKQRSSPQEFEKDERSRRIYNAREIPNRGETPSTVDPPDPKSPIWIDMDTFRDLLRSEAELRVRILGDDWAPTVKQESNWRLNLYKNWLWTLHNGVGESIVPPSRYERARKIKQEQFRGMDDPEPFEKKRTTRKSSPTRNQAKKTPRDGER